MARLRAGRAAAAGLLAALGVVFLAAGAIVDVLDLCAGLLASVLLIIAVEEGGLGYAAKVAAVTGAVAMLVFPGRSSAVVYILFFAPYMIVKAPFERLSRAKRILCKLAFLNGSVLVLSVLFAFFFSDGALAPWMYAAVFAVCNAIFPLYDLALTRLVRLYNVKYRKFIRKRIFFK